MPYAHLYRAVSSSLLLVVLTAPGSFAIAVGCTTAPVATVGACPSTTSAPAGSTTPPASTETSPSFTIHASSSVDPWLNQGDLAQDQAGDSSGQGPASSTQQASSPGSSPPTVPSWAVLAVAAALVVVGVPAALSLMRRPKGGRK